MGQSIEIEDRAEAYALRAVILYQHLQARKDRAGWVLGKQLLRCATSIGANLIEARAGESRKDFIHKCSISQKEARESKYWLRLLLKSKLVDEARLPPLIDETDQLIAIITRIIVNTKKRSAVPSSASRVQRSEL
jgi:four helix bundle protein